MLAEETMEKAQNKVGKTNEKKRRNEKPASSSPKCGEQINKISKSSHLTGADGCGPII